MGITGLLPLMEKASKKCNVSEFSKSTVVIDAYCWLHKGAFSCADKIVRGEFTDAHIKYCMKYVNMLLSHSIKPILVFDGRHLPAKAHTEIKRRESRKTAKKRAAELLRLGQMDEARSYMRRCVDITHEMALQLIKVCREKNVDCIVAPYEADAQMAYLNRIKVADVVITEDSDLVLFGCSKIFFKMDLNGDGVLVDSAKLPLVMKCPLEHYSFDKFRQMCIMSGCDYLPSLPGIGLAKARQFVMATRDPDITNALKKLPSYLNKSQLVVTDEYRDSFAKAEATFKHQLVYDPICRKLLPLNSLESEGTDEKLCSEAGEVLEPEVAFQLALGNLDPFTLRQMDDWHPDHQKEKALNSWNKTSIAPHKSIWSKDYLEYIQARTNKRNNKTQETGISFLPTKNITSKIVTTKTQEIRDNGLTIEDLSSMYCVKETIKTNVIIPETQDFEDMDILSSKNPFKCNTSMSNESKADSPASARKRRRSSVEKENSPEKEASPILESKTKHLRKFLKSNSLNNISKFKRTLLDTNNFVESKFFNSASVENAEEKNSSITDVAKLQIDDGENVTENIKNDDIQKVNDSEQYLNGKVMGNGDFVDLGILGRNNFNPFSINLVESKTTDSQSSYNDNTYPLENLITPMASQEFSDNIDESKKVVRSVTPSKSNIDSKTNKPPVPSFINNLEKSIPTINKCRRPGLQKRSSSSLLPTGQKTLANFGFFQKTQLKH